MTLHTLEYLFFKIRCPTDVTRGYILKITLCLNFFVAFCMKETRSENTKVNCSFFRPLLVLLGRIPLMSLVITGHFRSIQVRSLWSLGPFRSSNYTYMEHTPEYSYIQATVNMFCLTFLWLFVKKVFFFRKTRS